MKNEKKNNLKKFLADPRNKIFVKLGMWALFFMMFFLLASIGGSLNMEKRDPNKTTTKSINFTQMKQNLLEKNISINYEILYEDNSKSIIEGYITDNVLTGTIETQSKTQKFKYDGIDTFEIKMDSEIKNSTLLENTNQVFLLPTTLFELIKDSTPFISTSQNQKIYTYTLEEKSVSLYLSSVSIEKAIILDNNITYTLNFYIVIAPHA